MEMQKEKFLEGARKNRIPRSKAEKIFDLMAKFAEYGFNKSHSAAYALLAYETAYLKAHYPIEFMAASLTSEVQNPDKIVKYIAECRDMGIEILPPDLNESHKNFTVVGNQIRFGLAAVKNVGDAAIDAILAEREERRKIPIPLRFLSSRGSPEGESEGDRKPDQVRRLRLLKGLSFSDALSSWMICSNGLSRIRRRRENLS